MLLSQFTCCPTHFCTKYDICDTAAAEETAEKKQNFDEAQFQLSWNQNAHAQKSFQLKTGLDHWSSSEKICFLQSLPFLEFSYPSPRWNSQIFPAYRVMIALTAGMKFYQSNGAPFFDGMSCWFENVGSQIPHRIHNQTAFIGDILLVFTTRFMNTDYSKKVERNLIQTFCFQLQRARNINQ